MVALVAAASLLPSVAQGQTMRGDYDMDGEVTVADVTGMINYLLTGSPGEVPKTDRDTVWVKRHPFVMVRVHGGTYCRSFRNYKTVDHDYWLGQTEVTYELWKAVMGSAPIIIPYPDNAMYYVTYNDCLAFIDSLNAMTGRQFRLPTELEWEFAAFGGRFARGYTYSGSNDIGEVAWYTGNEREGRVYLSEGWIYNVPVASRQPNELGLYDMSGGVWEFCQARDQNLNRCPLRGGDRHTDAEYCLPTYSKIVQSTETFSLSGLRLAM